jgi:homoserine O-acetyltransferase/O-succinyltransferase
MTLPHVDTYVERWGEYEARLLPEPRPNPAHIRYATVFNQNNPLQLRLGGQLAPVRVAYATYGSLNARRDNAILVCHALTGSAQVAGPEGWWPDLVGPGRVLDTDRDFVICSNVLGGCYGTTGPTSPLPGTNRDYGPEFPDITIEDMVAVQHALLDRLNIDCLRAVVGGSMGGMQALSWLVAAPARVRAAVLIGAPPRHSAWGITFSHLARMAILGDPDFCAGRYRAQPQGLALARAITTLFFRSPASFSATQGRRPAASDVLRFAMETYLEHQGQKLLERFDANAYVSISKAMDRFDISDEVLKTITHPALCVGISSDLLYLPQEIEAMAALLPNGRYWELESIHGHDAFLIGGEAGKMAAEVRGFLEEVRGLP